MWQYVRFTYNFWVNQFTSGGALGRQKDSPWIQKELRFQYRIRIRAPKKMRYQAKGTKDLRDT